MAVIAFVTAGCSCRNSPTPCTKPASADEPADTAGVIAEPNAALMELPAACHSSPIDCAPSARVPTASYISSVPPSMPESTGRTVASKSSYWVPNSPTAAAFLARGSSMLSSAFTTSKNAVRAVSPPAANFSDITSAFIPSSSNASAVVSLPSLARILNSLTASPTLSTLNTPASAPSTRLETNSSADRPRAEYCAEYSFSTSSRSPFLSAPFCAPMAIRL